eukprot:evm.model.scf_1199.2 EVM.evm.TU.scf_1199.2   scf_1199:39747-42578(-)
MLLWELVAGRKAYHHLAQKDIIVDVVDGRRPPIPPHCPADITSLIQDCWQADHSRRPTFPKVVSRLRLLACVYAKSASYKIMRPSTEGEAKEGVLEDSWSEASEGAASSCSSDVKKPFVREWCGLPSPSQAKARSGVANLRGSLFRLESLSNAAADTPSSRTTESTPEPGTHRGDRASGGRPADLKEPGENKESRKCADLKELWVTPERAGLDKLKALSPEVAKRGPQWVLASPASPKDGQNSESNSAESNGVCFGPGAADAGPKGPALGLGAPGEGKPRDARRSFAPGPQSGRRRSSGCPTVFENLLDPPYPQAQPPPRTPWPDIARMDPPAAVKAVMAAMAAERRPSGWVPRRSGAVTTSMTGSEESWMAGEPAPPVSFDETRVAARVSVDVAEPLPMSSSSLITPRSACESGSL